MDKLRVIVGLCILSGIAMYLTGWVFEPSLVSFLAIGTGTAVAATLFVLACVSNDDAGH